MYKRSVLYTVSCFLALLFLSSCSSQESSPLLGVWKDNSGEIVLQFASDASFAMGISGYKAEGSYQANDSEIEISLKTNELGLEDHFIWNYSLENGALTLMKNGVSSVFHPLEEPSSQSSTAGE